MDEKSQIFVFTEEMIKEAVAGASFLVEDVSLAEAGVHEETEAKGHVTFADKIIDD
jgi:hypothetical protein